MKQGQWPALLMRQPYGKQIASTVTYAHPSWWASQGYLVVIQDVRGQGSSEGEFSGFEQETIVRPAKKESKRILILFFSKV